MRKLYTFLFYLALPFIFLRLWIKSRHTPYFRTRWRERLGYINFQNPQYGLETLCIWVHAVSLGESIAAIPMIKKLLSEYPALKIVMTSTTFTGAQQVQSELDELVTHSFFPYDIPSAIKRFFKNTQPKLVIIMETEIWPNLLYVAQMMNIPVLLANARLSEKSLQHYRWIKFFMRSLLNQFTCVAAQSAENQKRFLQLGLNENKVTITGNVKYDLELPDMILTQAAALRLQLNKKLIWVAGSTHEGEEQILLETFKNLYDQFPNFLFILVPRHPERSEKILELCQKYGFLVRRKSEWFGEQNDHQILLGDTLGELKLFYALSDIVFVGGSLVDVGGHNLIEPAALKKPIISGSYLYNFSEVAKLLQNHQAIKIISANHASDANKVSSLSNMMSHLLTHEDERLQMGDNAFAVYQANQGALAKHLNLISHLLPFLKR